MSSRKNLLIVSYDISDDKLRARFSRFLENFGYRLQYSVFRIRNSERILNLVKLGIEEKFKKKFSESDSILIYTIDEKSLVKYGYAKHEDDDLIIVS